MAALDGKVALITGGASGIGHASARALHALGADVVIVDRTEDAAAAVADELGGLAHVADVSRTDAWPEVVNTAVVRFGGIDIAHLNAGIAIGVSDMAVLTDEDYRRIMGVNLDGVVFGARAVIPEMLRRGGGHIVATSSLAGVIAFPGDPIYTATKHAVVGFVRSLAKTLLDQQITMNAVCPGLVDTPLIDGQIRDALRDSGFPLIAPEAVAEAVVWCVQSGETGRAVVVQAGLPPTPFRFARPPGPRDPDAVGKLPPEWLTDSGG